MTYSEDELVYEPKIDSASGLSRRQLGIIVIGLIGLAAGLGLGLLYTWQIDPVIEQNTRPDQLNPVDKNNYVIAVGLDYGRTGDLRRAYSLLGEVEPGKDPFQVAADTVCELTQTGQVQTGADIEAVRNLIAIFAPQPDIEVTCDVVVYATRPPVPTVAPIATTLPTPTIALAATKTPTLPGPTPTLLTDFGPPTDVPSRRDFVVSQPASRCNSDRPGYIMVRVSDENGFPLGGIPVEIQWDDASGRNREIFWTGLKADLVDAGYADFKMEEGVTYTVQLVDRSGLSLEMTATDTCSSADLISYEVRFQPR
ncbi:MAG: hypothetical protein L0154_07665 [Chloroflexi bacterium]|nr:hypothetical protein [Chloroflexota bacterium]